MHPRAEVLGALLGKSRTDNVRRRFCPPMQEDHFEAGELCNRKDRTVAGAENQPGQNPYLQSQSEGKRAGLLSATSDWSLRRTDPSVGTGEWRQARSRNNGQERTYEK